MQIQMKYYVWRMAVVFSLFFGVLIGDAYLANRSTQGLTEAQELIAHSWEVRVKLRDTQIQFEKSISAGRGYVLLDDVSNIQTMEVAQKAMKADIDNLSTLVKDNALQLGNIKKLRVIVEDEVRVVAEAVSRKQKLGELWKADKSRAFTMRALSSKNYTTALLACLSDMEREESRLSLVRHREAKSFERQTRLTIFGAAGIACAALVATFILAYLMLRERFRGESVMRLANTELEVRVGDRTASLQQANEHLQMANNELEAFSYTVSHDLRAPLRHMVGFADLLEQKAAGLLDESGQRYLNLIKEAGLRAGRLIDDLLTFSRMSRAELRHSLIPMQEIVDRICGELNDEHPSHKIHWAVMPLPSVWGDPVLANQVWRNLLDNAVKYSGKQEISEVTVGYRKTTTELEFYVRDNGVGFDMSHAEKLFGVFQRLHETEDFEGTGIGLVTVRRIIVRHGGRTWAQSEPGHGATFYFSLPLTCLEKPE